MEVFYDIDEGNNDIFCFLFCEHMIFKYFFQGEGLNVLEDKIKGMIILKCIEGFNNKLILFFCEEVELILKGFYPVVVIKSTPNKKVYNFLLDCLI